MITKPARLKTKAPETPWKEQEDRRYATFLEQLPTKGRMMIQKYTETCETEGKEGYADLWKRLAGRMGTLAPHATETQGPQGVKFFIPDGKYKQQVFALEQTKTDTVVVYLPDVTTLAVQRKVLSRPSPARYTLPGGDVELPLEVITAETRDMTVCKAMLGWGRRALRVELQLLEDAKRIQAIEQLCELAAEAWPAATAAVQPI